MGEVSCDILSGEQIYCVFVRFVDTTHSPITAFKSPDRFEARGIESVSHAIFYRGILPKFPRELSTFFPNLKYIDIFDCGLEEITKEDLKHFPKLEKLKVDSNKLKFLPGDLFEYNPKIRHLTFTNNKIDAIGEQLVDKLEFLTDADFSGNKCINFKFSTDFDTIEELKEIIKRECKPLKDLQKLAINVLLKTKHIQDMDMLEFIGDRLNICELKEKVRDDHLKAKVSKDGQSIRLYM